MSIIRALLSIAVAGLAAVPASGSAQGLGALRKKAEEAKKRVETAVDKKPNVDTAKAKPAPAAAAPSSGPAASTAAGTAATPGEAAAKPNAKVWENYDFVPGNKVLFYTDFAEDKVGNFARGLKYVSGPIEVVERDGAKLLRSTGKSTILIPVGRKLPERFTLELDVLSTNTGIVDQIVIEGGKDRGRTENSAEIDWSPRGTFIIGSGQNGGTSSVSIPDAMQAQLINAPAHLRVLMDSGYFKMYVNERRMYNNPDLQFRRDSVIRVEVYGTDELPVFLTSVRLAESETDVLYDALAAKGRWATQGILFATGKAVVQPESRPVLKEIAGTLKEHADLKILIEGHTDNVGSSAANLTLSDARAAAVKAALVADFGVAGDRITTKGLGDTKPSVPNTTPAGRAQNRRVEVVRQ
ncbi:MAG TPA: OmpA family protein [Gemmatimonadaceae bacterium]|nr:OmpA family protein [Gemmatimonadaceae bacterium]